MPFCFLADPPGEGIEGGRSDEVCEVETCNKMESLWHRVGLRMSSDEIVLGEEEPFCPRRALQRDCRLQEAAVSATASRKASHAPPLAPITSPE